MRRLVICALICMAACRAGAAVVYVDQGATGPKHDGKTWKTAYRTISDAVSRTTGGDIWIKGGIYVERIILTRYHNLYGGFTGTERSVSERVSSAARTAIDPRGSGRAIYVARDARCIIDGLTLRRGLADRGGGFRCNTNSVVRIRDCRFEVCTASEMGGGVYFGTYAQGEVTNSCFLMNRAPLGGAAVVEYHSYPILSFNVFAWNRANESGGAVYCPFHSGAYLRNCTMVFNSAGLSGGAVYAYEGGPVTLDACILAFNSAAVGGGIYGGGGASATTFTDCDLFANVGGEWGGAIRTPPAWAGNFHVDPMFIAPRQMDFRLAPGSPCAGIGAYP